MRLRIPFFMKKRGQRRTGVRWLGRVGEGIVYGLLTAAGIFGLALLFLDLLPQPWPWLVAVIPASLVVYGVLGLIEVLWQTSTSTELRSAVAKKAGDLESLLAPEGAVPSLPNVPPVNDVVDSAGVRLEYRLPIDSSPNLLLFAMTLMGLGWNLLVAMFVFQVVALHQQGEPNWMLTWLMIPFVLAGVWTIIALVREIAMTTGIGATRLEIAGHPLYAGNTYRGFVSQTGRANVRWLNVVLECEEHATFSQGTDTRSERCRVHRQVLYRVRKRQVRPDQPLEEEFALVVPVGAMHSFHSPHNSVDWALVVRGRVARWPIFERRFPIYVYPSHLQASRPALVREPVARETAP